MITNSKDQSILELLAMTIFADKQIFAAEIRAFTKSVLLLQEQGVIETQMSEANVILWYETHKDELQSLLQTERFENWMDAKIIALQTLSNKVMVLEAIEYIAKSDEEEHISEKALRVLASRICEDLSTV